MVEIEELSKLYTVDFIGKPVASINGEDIIIRPAICTINYNPDIEWDSEDKGYRDYSGRQVFNLDRLYKGNYRVTRYESDCNVFYAVCIKHSEYAETRTIDRWESVFWPTAGDTICEKLRHEIPKCIILYTEGKLYFILEDYVIEINKFIHLETLIAVLHKFYEIDIDDNVLSKLKTELIEYKITEQQYEELFQCIPTSSKHFSKYNTVNRLCLSCPEILSDTICNTKTL